MCFEERPRWLRIALAAAATIVFLLTVPAGVTLWAYGFSPPSDKRVLFVSVKAADGSTAATRFDARYDAHARVPLYLVKEGELYLRLQTSQTFYAFQHVVDSVRWNAAMLAELVRQHPELRAMLPDPGAPDGGVRWLFPLPAPGSAG
jgi:hypothetical protein